MTVRPALPRRSCAAPVLALLLFAAPLAAAPVAIGDTPKLNPDPSPEPATSVAIDPLASGALCLGRPVTVSATCVEAVPSDDEPAPIGEAAAGRSFLVRTHCSRVDGEPLRWVVVQTGQQGTGGVFSFVATSPGPHQVMAVAGGRIVSTVSYWIDGDSDGDGLSDSCDNCPEVANLEQGDADADGYGDTCDTNPVGPCQTETEQGTLVALPASELAAIWGGAEQKCSKCDTATTKCPAQTASDCQCTSVTVGFLTFNRCGVSCPSGGGYRKCIKSDKETDKCDPVKTTARWCTSYAFKWDGPGKPPSCPANFDCNNNPGTGSSETVPGDHASCS